MHYYKRNLGDYAKKAGRLSMLQHGSYTLLIDACYDREQFPTRDEAIDWTWASSTAEVEAVDFVLAKFFTLEDDRYVQTRIREELADYHEKSATNKRIADERETKRKAEPTKRAPVVNEAPPNHKPLTINQEPLGERPGKPVPPATGKKKADKTLKTYLDECREVGVKPIPGDHHVLQYARDAGISDEMVQVAWVVFKEGYTEDSDKKIKRYTDWPGHFSNAVKKNWGGLWYVKDGVLAWSSVGELRKAALDARMKAKGSPE